MIYGGDGIMTPTLRTQEETYIDNSTPTRAWPAAGRWAIMCSSMSWSR
jgi:hypothetical protein